MGAKGTNGASGATGYLQQEKEVAASEAVADLGGGDVGYRGHDRG